MKRFIIVSMVAGFTAIACNDSSSDNIQADSSTGEQTSAPAEQSASATNASQDTNSAASEQSSPFMASMNKMMQDMMSMKMTEDPDHDFAMMMKTHHEGAIDMSNIELQQGKNDEFKQVAQKIIDDSKKDIADLDKFMSSHQPSKKSDFAKKSMEMMHKDANMQMNHSGDLDQQFASMMAKHHRDGIDMAKLYLKSATQQQTKTVANRTIKANSEDLSKLQKHTMGGNKQADTATDHSQH